MESEEKERILKAVASYEEDMTTTLIELINIPSISEDLKSLEKGLDYILDLAERLGFHSEKVLDGQIGIVEIGHGEEVLGILAHVDVVPPGDRSIWHSEPFQGEVRDGRVYGRGAMDDKGPVIAVLYGMKAILDQGKPLHKKIRFIIGTQEEVEWTDMDAYVKQYPLPDYGFTPDGEFPLCNVEKGCLDVTYEFDFREEEDLSDGSVLAEIRGGTMTNTVPGSCEGVILHREEGTERREVITTLGKAVHSSQPENGENAIFVMADGLKGRKLKENRLLKVLRATEEYFRDIYGKNICLYSEDEYYDGEFVHRNVFSPTILMTEKEKIHLHINARYPYGTEGGILIDALDQRMADLEGRRIVTSDLKPVFVSRERPFIKAFGEAYEEATGRPNELVLAYGGSYAKAMPNVVSWGPIFPGEEDTCHEENEYISIESLVANAKIFALAIGKIGFSTNSFK